MTPEHVRLCASGEWGELVERVLGPWVLEGRDLGDRVLEVGAGPGLVTDVLRRRAPWVVAVELDEPLAAALGRRLEGGNVEVVTADGTDTPGRRELHAGDVFLPVPPAELPARLSAAGFADPLVDTRDDRLRFIATAPGAGPAPATAS